MNYDFVIKNGMVVDPVNGIHQIMDIGVKRGKIVDVKAEINSCESIINVSGSTVIPGGIDMHVHCDNSLGSPLGFYMVASTGITTIVDFAGPTDEIIDSMMKNKTYGLNIAVMQMVKPNDREKNALSYTSVEEQLERAMSTGALGLKVLGGHFPLTPQATEYAIAAANTRKVMIAIHSGTTDHKSDIEGMRETIELANGLPIILAHINAYCRGKVHPYLLELNEAFTMLRNNPNVYADSHLATMNACHGLCVNSFPQDQITINCLEMFGYDATEEGLKKAILNGLVRVLQPKPLKTVLIERNEAFDYWQNNNTNTMISFPANIAATATVCALERRTPGGEFLIGMTSSDGGGIPRNDLINRILCLYKMGYLSLEDVVMKISTTPARVFGFTNKGHLGIGADADITILNMKELKPVMSFAAGKMIMKDGQCVGDGGLMLITKDAIKHVESFGLKYDVINLHNSSLYK